MQMPDEREKELKEQHKVHKDLAKDLQALDPDRDGYKLSSEQDEMVKERTKQFEDDLRNEIANANREAYRQQLQELQKIGAVDAAGEPVDPAVGPANSVPDRTYAGADTTEQTVDSRTAKKAGAAKADSNLSAQEKTDAANATEAAKKA
jgi:hypothetical protein